MHLRLLYTSIWKLFPVKQLSNIFHFTDRWIPQFKSASLIVWEQIGSSDKTLGRYDMMDLFFKWIGKKYLIIFTCVNFVFFLKKKERKCAVSETTNEKP